MKAHMQEKRSISMRFLFLILFTLFLNPISPSIMAITTDPLDVTFDPAANQPPYPPINPYPANNTVDIESSTLLSVEICDPSSKYVTVYFYNALDNAIIDTEYNVSTNFGCTIASIRWNDTQKGKIYQWYAVINDSEYENISETWYFTTKPKPTSSSPANQFPITNITGPNIAYVNETVIFYSNNSYDPDGYITGYRWDLNNDGLFDTEWQKEILATYSYTKPGYKTVKLQVKDNQDAFTTAYHIIQIIPLNDSLQLPIPQINGPYYGNVDKNITFSSAGSYDPDGIIVNYTWNFGDNHISYIQNPTHSYEKSGNYTIMLTVIDNDNLSNLITSKAIISDNKTKKPDGTINKLPLTFLLIILMTIIVCILLILFRQRDYNFSESIKQDISHNNHKNENIDRAIDRILSKKYTNWKTKPSRAIQQKNQSPLSQLFNKITKR
ncbi:MAG: PKD domain-containing protein [Candidatus Thermoplasmatota archaeon]|nr:PKD domain-containing protein [Candidatus Thermoplasmatota archaeon]MBU1941665.1 PKD domain-containing protein [Candidatus Thermoplasmatota archaeon]